MLRRHKKLIGIAGAALMVSGALTIPASAQGLFEALFGGGRRASPPPSASSYADPLTALGDMLSGDRGQVRSAAAGPGMAYCVRTCDGAFFPVQRSGGSTAELCKSFAPAAKTKVFFGSSIDGATASDGTRYADLDNAFVYREKVVAGCTWNGKPAGVAALDPKNDPTLRAGDIVATSTGLVAYTGGKNDKSKEANFTPVSNYGNLPKTQRAQLAATRVMPVPAPVSTAPVASTRDDARGTALSATMTFFP